MNATFVSATFMDARMCFSLGGPGGVHSAAEIRDTPKHPYMERRM